MENIKTWKTREEAQKLVNKLDNSVYVLSYGEYERPTYKVKKIRNKEAYGIWIKHFYYIGTYNVRKDGFMNKEEAFYTDL